MKALFHASQLGNIKVLEPRVSNHGVARVYFADKKENVLVYLSNAVEKHCRETGFEHGGIFKKWATYGFDENGIMKIEEYYPNALYDTYGGVRGYIYTVSKNEQIEALSGITGAYFSAKAIAVDGCEYIEDAYTAIIEAEKNGLIKIARYEEHGEAKLNWIKKTVKAEFEQNENHPEYRHFLIAKFKL